MSIERNPQAMAMAFKKCRGKIAKIQELSITPDMSEEDIEALIAKLATAKAEEDNSAMADHVKGQRWYVEGLIKFSGLTVEEQLEAEYEDSFADTASESEMLESLRKLSA